MTKSQRFAICGLLSLLGVGCVPYAKVESDKAGFTAERVALAGSLEQQGDLAGALREWRIVHAVDPSNAAAKQKTRELPVLMSERAGAQLEEAKRLLKQGNRKSAKSKLLKTLALEPTNNEAHALLRDIETRRVQYNQRKHLEAFAEPIGDSSLFRKRETPKAGGYTSAEPSAILQQSIALAEQGQLDEGIELLSTHVAKHPNDQSAREVLADLHHGLAETYRNDKNYTKALHHLEETRRLSDSAGRQIAGEIAIVREALAEQLYIEGVLAYEENIDVAIAHWQQALEYNAEHKRARLRLQEAQKASASE